MGFWEKVFAAGYDRVMSAPEQAVLRGHRRVLIAQARGRVLEIGGGTGANLPFYGPEVTELLITEPSEAMAAKLRPKLAEHQVPARLEIAAGESLPFPEDWFDYAVCTLVLCTVADPGRALAELRRVLKPGGRLVFLEHVRAQEPGLQRWQDRLHPLHVRLGNGCHCNRTTLQSIVNAGFEVQTLTRDRMRRAPPIVAPLIAGVAASG